MLIRNATVEDLLAIHLLKHSVFLLKKQQRRKKQQITTRRSRLESNEIDFWELISGTIVMHLRRSL